MFSSAFISAIQKLTNNTSLAEKLWNDIVHHYSDHSRYYHTLSHLEFVYHELQPVQNIRNWDIIILAIAYHDIIYNVLKGNNEEKSAAYAKKILSGLIADEKLNFLHEMIMATKNHALNKDPDINHFTDADLSILGAEEEDYLNYTRQIRKEYKIFPDIMYKQGRQKLLQHFLKMNKIFKTSFFSHKYELQARINLKKEFRLLSGKDYV